MKIDELIGKTLVKVDDGKVGSDCIIFTVDDDTVYRMYHEPDCCESVAVEDICGDIADLIGSPIVQAEESTSDQNPDGVVIEWQDSFTWTFYRIATAKGLVVIRWYGSSSGYYSESVNFDKMDEG